MSLVWDRFAHFQAKGKAKAAPKRKATVSVKALASCSCPSIDERLPWGSKQFVHSVSLHVTPSNEAVCSGCGRGSCFAIFSD